MPPPPGVPAQGGQFQGREPIQVGFAPSAPQSRVTIFFRWLMIIPHAIVLYFVQIGAAFVFFIGWWAALFTGRLPDSFAEFLTGTLRWYTRVHGYQALLYDAYPPFTFDDMDYPLRVATRPGRLNRAAVFFRIILIFPALLLTALAIYGQAICGLVIWLIVLITGRMPESLYQATAAVVRWMARVQGFYWMLTSEYPGGLFGDPAGSAQAARPTAARAQRVRPAGPGRLRRAAGLRQQRATASSVTASSGLRASSRPTASRVRPAAGYGQAGDPYAAQATPGYGTPPQPADPYAAPARPAPPARPPPRARSRGRWTAQADPATARRPRPALRHRVRLPDEHPGYQTAPGSGTAPYSPAGGYGQVAMANQDQWAVRGAPPWPLVLSDGAKKLVALFIGLGPLAAVGVAVLAVVFSAAAKTSGVQSLQSLGQPTASQGTGADSGNGSGGTGGTHVTREQALHGPGRVPQVQRRDDGLRAPRRPAAAAT
jgi:hypothetical protein